MARLVLHIGDPKTGSTAIQSALWRGLGGPHVTAWPRFSANDLVQPFRDKDTDHAASRLLVDWFRSADTDVAVLSSELLQSVYPGAIKGVIGALLPELGAAPDRITAVGYIRPHASRLCSAFAQRVKTGRWHRTLDPFLETHLQKPLLDYSGRFLNWQRVFGRQAVMRPFLPETLARGDVVADFFALLGVDLAGSGTAGASRANESLRVPALALLRHLHALWRRAGIEPRESHLIGAGLGQETARRAPQGEKVRLNRAQAHRLARLRTADAKEMDRAFFDAPILETALRNAVDTAPDREPGLDARDHYRADTIARAEDLATALLSVVSADRQLWSLHHRLHRVEGRTGPQIDARFAGHKDRLAEGEALLGAIADILARPDHDRERM